MPNTQRRPLCKHKSRCNIDIRFVEKKNLDDVFRVILSIVNKTKTFSDWMIQQRTTITHCK